MKDFKFRCKERMGIGDEEIINTVFFKSELRYELTCLSLYYCTDSLLEEIADRTITQPMLALTYALAIKSKEDKDWKKINEAIIKRWSLSGLKRVKGLAWIGFDKDFWKGEKRREHEHLSSM